MRRHRLERRYADIYLLDGATAGAMAHMRRTRDASARCICAGMRAFDAMLSQRRMLSIVERFMLIISRFLRNWHEQGLNAIGAEGTTPPPPTVCYDFDAL